MMEASVVLSFDDYQRFLGMTREPVEPSPAIIEVWQAYQEDYERITGATYAAAEYASWFRHDD